MKVYNIFDSEGNFIKGINVRNNKDLKKFEEFFGKDIDVINNEIKEKKTVTKDGKEYRVKLMYTLFI